MAPLAENDGRGSQRGGARGGWDGERHEGPIPPIHCFHYAVPCAVVRPSRHTPHHAEGHHVISHYSTVVLCGKGKIRQHGGGLANPIDGVDGKETRYGGRLIPG